MTTASLLRRLRSLFTSTKPVLPRDRAALNEHRDIWLGKQSRAVAKAARHYSF